MTTKHAVGGEVAIELARQLAEPIRALRDRLGLVVDHLERHVATSTGPTPYPWRSLQTLRQDLAAAYLEATQLSRRLEELDRALHDGPPVWFDLAAAVDLGLRLASHHLGPGIELLFDLGNVPPVQGTPGGLALLVAQLVAVCAKSAREAMSAKRPLWLLDEPTSALDREAQDTLAGLMRQHLTGGGIIVAAAHGPIGLEHARELRLGASE